VYLLYTDETNMNPDNSEFFVYAGVSIPGDKAAALSAEIESLRKRNGYQAGDVLKFNTVERPPHINGQQHLAAKRELMGAAVQHGVKLFASFLLHNIVRDGDTDQARRNEINRICFHFDEYLRTVDDYGLVLVDTFTDLELNRVLREKFSIGITGKLPYSQRLPLPRILGYHQATIGTSHFTSVIDVVLGALRYAVNTRARKRTVCKTLIGQIAPLCIADGSANGRVSDLSINFSPKEVRVARYLDQYKQLCAFLRESGIDPGEEPSAS
jgi:hypothetical protein